MTAFRYRAARADGATVRGTVDAASAGAAAALLSDRGLFPVRVEPTAADGERSPWRRPSARAGATVLHSLASLVETGVPLQRALEAAETVAAGPLRESVRRLAARVGEGWSLATAMADADGLFSPVSVGLLRAGERGVGLGPALQQAADQLEREAETAARIRAAMVYPLVLLAVGTASILLIVLFVIPRFAALLQDVDAALPTTTRVLLGSSAFLREHAEALLLAGAATVSVGTAVARRHRERWSAALLGLPLIGPIRHALASARVCRTLGALLGSGVSALPALAVARDAAGDRAIAARLAQARDRVAEGETLATAFEATSAVTPVAVKLARIGENGGRVASLLTRAAELDEREAERTLRALVSLLEPALILGFALVVALVAAAILQAVYSVRPV